MNFIYCIDAIRPAHFFINNHYKTVPGVEYITELYEIFGESTKLKKRNKPLIN